MEALLAHADFEAARTVVEFGCGTGRLAERLLQHVLPPEAQYLGFDLSGTMVGLARQRLASAGPRARVVQTEGQPSLALPGGLCDRFLATYVLDLLSDTEARAVVREAHRLLAAGGRLCLVSLCPGNTAFSRAVQAVWELAHRIRPQLVGGCRPLRLVELLDAGWRLEHRQVLCRLGLCSEVLVAAKAGPARPSASLGTGAG